MSFFFSVYKDIGREYLFVVFVDKSIGKYGSYEI